MKEVSKAFLSFLVTIGSFLSLVLKKKQPTMRSAATFKVKESRSVKYGCLAQSSKGQKRPKYASPESTKNEQKILHCGQSTARFVTGSSEKGKERPSESQSLPQFSLFWLFCLSFVFAASLTDTTSLTIGSHNLHSFKKSVNYHKSCLERYGGLWFGQELWLTESQLPMLQKMGTHFVARSGMEQAVSSRLMVGRPFGGVSICWSHDLDHLISPLANFRHKRVVGVELKSDSGNYLFLCVYMPFYDSSRRTECINETVDAITMMENIIEQHPGHSVIIGGDFNTELQGNSPFDCFWNNFITKNQLSCCDTQFPQDSFTYHHHSLDQKKWIDHFLVSSTLLKGNSSNFHILNDGDNLLDHLPIVMNLQIQIQRQLNMPEPQQRVSRLDWDGLSESHINAYTSSVCESIDLLPDATSFCHVPCLCFDNHCHNSIQREYDNLISCLRNADSCLPRKKAGITKDWWTDGLTELKNRSIEIHSIWKREGCPHQGPTHQERLRVRAQYKTALRQAQRAPKQAAWDRMHSSLAQKDSNSFWKSWRRIYNKNKSKLPSIVDGISSQKGIAETFKKCSEKNSTPNNQEKVDAMNSRFESEYSDYMHRHKESCDCADTNVTTIDVIDALLRMKGGKSADEDGIVVEHLHHAPLNFLSRLASLFNHMLRHSFVPRQFQRGFMIPLIKDQQGNHSDSNNYRGITISPIISKVFEHILKCTFAEHLSTSSYQFGFKKQSSTVHALHCLRETIDYYTNNDSRVFCTFLDASKAFDCLIHSGLFVKMMSRKVPVIFLNIIITWYSDLWCRVKWGDTYSNWFAVTAGVRQGGILSPDFYSIYVDDLILKLKACKRGCYFLSTFAAALFYADDMAVLAPSIHGLQSLLQICGDYCLEWDIALNAKKSKNMTFGKKIAISHDILLNGKVIDWVTEWVYLGVNLKSYKNFDCSITNRVKKSYRCANAIFRIDGRSNDLVMLQLVESHCVPILTYAVENIHVSNRDERRQLRVAYNSLFRKIFNYCWSESVSALQAFLGRPTWEQIVEKRRKGFVNRVRKLDAMSLPVMLLQ